MYYYIKGTLVQKNDNYIVVDANGVGYMIYTSLNSMQNAGEVGKKITIYTYLHVREDNYRRKEYVYATYICFGCRS